MRVGHPSRLRQPQGLALALCLAAACQGVSKDSIQTWKQAPDGEDKLVMALKSQGVEASLRAQAAAALVDRGAVDRMASVISSMSYEERSPIIAALAPLVAGALGSADAGKAWDAREALFSLRQQATTEAARAPIDAALLPALKRDLETGHTEGGRRTSAQMLVEIRAPALPLAQDVLDNMAAPFPAAVEVVEKIGDKAARAKGGAALAKRARREATVPANLWTALGTLGGKEAGDFLVEKIETGKPEEADKAAETLTKLERDPGRLAFALRLVGQADTRPPVREKLLEVVEKIGTEDGRKGLVTLIGTEKDPAFRYRLFKATVKVGGGPAVLPALEALPATAEYQSQDVAEHVVKTLQEMGGESHEGLTKALQSKSPVARLFAVWTLEKSGFASDADAIRKLAKDRGHIKGPSAHLTIGAEATRVADLLKKQG